MIRQETSSERAVKILRPHEIALKLEILAIHNFIKKP